MSRRWRVIFTLAAVAITGSGYAADWPARLDWARRVELGTPVTGVVQAVTVRERDRVDQGQVLVRLDPRRFLAEANAAKAELESKTPDREEARRELDRAQELYDRTVLSDHDLQLARIAMARAEAAYQRALADRVKADLALEYSTVRAPFAGVIVATRVEVGQTVVNRLRAEPLIGLAATGRMLAVARVPEQGAIVPGARVSVTVAGEDFAGRVLSVRPLSGNVRSGAGLEVRVAFSYPQAREFYAGQPARVSSVTKTHDE